MYRYCADRDSSGCLVDVYTRECLALEVDTSFASRRVTRVLEAIIAERGARRRRFAATTGRVARKLLSISG